VLEPVTFAATTAHLRHVLEPDTFDDCVRSGAAMDRTAAVHYAHLHINTIRQQEP
jgi:hypothetical protein